MITVKGMEVNIGDAPDFILFTEAALVLEAVCVEMEKQNAKKNIRKKNRFDFANDIISAVKETWENE